MILESVLSLSLLLAENPGPVADAAKQVQSIVQYKAASTYNHPIYYHDQVLVLTYHHISHQESDYTISPEQFESHLNALKDNHYNVIGMDQFLRFRKGETVPPNSVLITFDDGYESFYTHAYPALKKMGYPATNFIVVKSTDIYNPQTLPHLNWDQMREMKRNSMSFYNHTYDLHRYGNTSAEGNPRAVLANAMYLPEQSRVETVEEYRSRIYEDLAMAEKRLDEELGDQPNLLAFPFGKYSEDVISVGKELGIEEFFLFLEEGITESESPVVHRVNGGHVDLSADRLLDKLQSYNTIHP